MNSQYLELVGGAGKVFVLTFKDLTCMLFLLCHQLVKLEVGHNKGQVF